VFFTRWVTHFCAPLFVFLAGTSAFLHGRKLASRGALSPFLLTRGLWLVVLELTVIRFSWTFNFDYANYSLAGVIWVIGWSMVVLAALIHLPTSVVAAIGLILVVGHHVLFAALPSDDGGSWLAKLVYLGGAIELGPSGPPLLILYVLVPWVGVMACGYAFGRVMQLESARRRRACLGIGVGALAAFFLMRGFDLYGDPNPWRAQTRLPALLAFLNTSKYPASFLFLAMTLGPAIALIPWLEGARGRIASVLSVFGRVPLFYYLLHIPLIHLAALIVSLARTGSVDPWLFANHPLAAGPAPAGYAYPLWLLYAVTAAVVVALYFPCRWFAGVRAKRASRWTSYL
jgi:uncharacterized membrane protein